MHAHAGPAQRGADVGTRAELAPVPQPAQLLHVARRGGGAQDAQEEQEHACWRDRVGPV